MSSSNSRGEFLDKVRQERDARRREKTQAKAVLKLQGWFRAILARKALVTRLEKRFDEEWVRNSQRRAKEEEEKGGDDNGGLFQDAGGGAAANALHGLTSVLMLATRNEVGCSVSSGRSAANEKRLLMLCAAIASGVKNKNGHKYGNFFALAVDSINTDKGALRQWCFRVVHLTQTVVVAAEQVLVRLRASRGRAQAYSSLSKVLNLYLATLRTIMDPRKWNVVPLEAIGAAAKLQRIGVVFAIKIWHPLCRAPFSLLSRLQSMCGVCVTETRAKQAKGEEGLVLQMQLLLAMMSAPLSFADVIAKFGLAATADVGTAPELYTTWLRVPGLSLFGPGVTKLLAATIQAPEWILEHKDANDPPVLGNVCHLVALELVAATSKKGAEVPLKQRMGEWGLLLRSITVLIDVELTESARIQKKMMKKKKLGGRESQESKEAKQQHSELELEEREHDEMVREQISLFVRGPALMLLLRPLFSTTTDKPITTSTAMTQLEAWAHATRVMKLDQGAVTYTQDVCGLLLALLAWISARESRRDLAYGMLQELSYNTHCLQALWVAIEASLGSTLGTSRDQRLWFAEAFLTDRFGVANLLELFVRCYLPQLIIASDEHKDFLPGPFRTAGELKQFALVLKTVVFHCLWNGEGEVVVYEDEALFQQNSGRGFYIQISSRKSLLLHCRQVLNELYRRDVRTAFMSDYESRAAASSAAEKASQKERKLNVAARTQDALGKVWTVDTSTRAWQCAWDAFMLNEHFPKKERVLQVLEDLNFAVPFLERVKLLRMVVAEDKKLHAQSHNALRVKIRRSHLLHDAFMAVNTAGGANLRNRRLLVTFVDEHGREEKGIDVGGPFKEFVELTVNDLFVTSGVFVCNQETQSFYPNPNHTYVESYHAIMQFAGRMIGKALYEGVLLNHELAPFFLKKVLGLNSTLSDLQDLDSREFYRSLMYIKTCAPDEVEDLCLTFSVTEDVYGEARSYDLKHNGANVAVTESNRMLYVFMLADFYLNRRLNAQTTSFLSGFQDVIKPHWTHIFNASELRVLLSGDSEANAIDIDDWREHTVYQGTSASSKPIATFWKAVASLTPKQRMGLLKFATSSSKPPLGGFKHLVPPFTIRLIPNPGAGGGVSFLSRLFSSKKTKNKPSKGKLPGASTCFNLLKLPAYTNAEVLREKLEVVIANATGFELS
jgi:hypothetical protein